MRPVSWGCAPPPQLADIVPPIPPGAPLPAVFEDLAPIEISGDVEAAMHDDNSVFEGMDW